ncbi:hypothetical protein BN7_4241 [Wickerhamomyces ciferrii]|uniref:U1 snRNP-associated protein n=1 Tax=Wickerhamomyces ciferrii (strain ATCC 14091 / BCRC 22168 / CBS 111 / JCM 3599 / NBRC 0793 / NRRL Y-1031 F-60-10) TaxID=1206466 RepID=K0KTV2_WICCF|nr:uncharacterized protein BN7_4241 [Wickerhamomyces ciferrii]CCH44673.1 hypothetical protein BN7_4241 [Wickerhamomyces ciferrii]
MMARYEQRELLEQLMGRDTLINPSRQRRELGLSDPKICKSFLLGICPYDLFNSTKQDMGRCNKIHLEKHKLQYEREIAQGKEYPDFDIEVIQTLNRFIVDVNRKIDVALKRLEHTPEEKLKISEAAKELEAVDSRINIMIQEIEKLTENKQVLKALDQSVKLQELSVKREYHIKKLRDVTENAGQSAQQKLQVCEVCGAYLSRLDSDRRLSDHFLGKIHLGYVQMRDKLDELKRKHKND